MVVLLPLLFGYNSLKLFSIAEEKWINLFLSFGILVPVIDSQFHISGIFGKIHKCFQAPKNLDIVSLFFALCVNKFSIGIHRKYIPFIFAYWIFFSDFTEITVAFLFFYNMIFNAKYLFVVSPLPLCPRALFCSV